MTLVYFFVPKVLGHFEYGSDPLDGDVMNLSFAPPVPYDLAGFKLGPRRAFGGGAPVSTENFPTKLGMLGPKRELPPFENQYSLLLVSQEFLDVVAAYQKEIQALPVACFWRDRALAGKRFFLFTTLLLDAIDRERTTATWRPLPRGAGMWQRPPGSGNRFPLVFSKERIGGHHFWRDPHLPSDPCFVTDELFEALKSNGFNVAESQHFPAV